MRVIKDYFELVRPNHLPTNILIFLTSALLSLIITKEFSLNIIPGLISFIILYGSVYLFNDIIDMEIDKKHHVKWKRERPLPSGRINKTNAFIIYCTLLITGLAISRTINITFHIIMMLLVLMNISHTGAKLKNHTITGLLSIGVIQFLKFFAGWTSINPSLNLFPLSFSILFSLGYLIPQIIYRKQKFSSEKKYKQFISLMSITAFIMYVLSLISWPQLRLSLILLIPALSIIGGFMMNTHNKKGLDDSFTNNLKFAPIMYSCILLLLLLPLLI